jgi:hypothetical protein
METGAISTASPAKIRWSVPAHARKLSNTWIAQVCPMNRSSDYLPVVRDGRQLRYLGWFAPIGRATGSPVSAE